MKKLFCLAAAVGAVAFISCRSLPEKPEWVETPPPDSGGYSYFVGAGTDAGGDEAAAAEEAASRIVSDISRFVGVSITSETTVEAKDAFGRFESVLESEVTESSSARLSGLAVRDRWVDRTSDGQVTVYILAEYDTKTLAAEKDRIQSLFREREESVSGPELEGDSLYSEGRPYRAAVKYIEAALAASGLDEDNSELRFERNMQKARNAVELIKMEAVTAPGQTYVDTPFAEPFRVRLSSPSGNLSGLPVSVSYKETRSNGRKAARIQTVLTDSDGIAEFSLPSPSSVGNEKLVMFLDMRAVTEPLEGISFRLLQYVDGFQQVVNSRRVIYDYSVISRAVEVPTCIMVMDVDRSGNPLDRADTAGGILSVMTESGFNTALIPVDYRMTAISDPELIALIGAEYAGVYERLIFGRAEISSFEEDGGSYIVKVTGSVKAVDLQTGRLLYSSVEQKRARGGNNSATISAAFNSLGKLYGEALISGLP